MASPAILSRLPLGLAQESAFWESWLFWVLVAGLILAVVALGYFIRLLRITLRLFVSTQMPGTSDSANGHTVAGDLHPFPSRDGTGLVGAFIDPPPGTPIRGTIIFAPEFKGDLHTAARYTAGLVPLGYRIFTFDFRGHGRSDNCGTYQPMHWVTEHEVNDMLAAVGYVESTAPAAGHPIAVMGVSRGACAAAIAALYTPVIRVLVLDGLFSTDMMVESLMKRYAQIFASIHIIRPSHPAESFAFLRVFTLLYAELKLRCRYPLVRKIMPHLKRVPMLFVYGGDDTFIDEAQRIKLYRIKTGVKQLAVVPGARHNQAVAVDGETYNRLIGEFLDQHMPAVPEGDRHG